MAVIQIWLTFRTTKAFDAAQAQLWHIGVQPYQADKQARRFQAIFEDSKGEQVLALNGLTEQSVRKLRREIRDARGNV